MVKTYKNEEKIYGYFKDRKIKMKYYNFIEFLINQKIKINSFIRYFNWI